jgi:NADH dehydrogenase
VPVIAIVGGGFGGIAVAAQLERHLRPGEADIVVLSRDNYTLFTPMLPEVTSGELEVRHIVTPIRTQLRRSNFILSDVERIDVASRSLEYRHVLTGRRRTLPYDFVVLAMGSSTSTFGLPGVEKNVWALKTLHDADALRNRLVWLLELADTTDDVRRRRELLTLVVVGGGFTGVEAAGEIYELFRSVVRFYRNIRLDDVRMVLVEAGTTLLAGLPAKMGVYAERVLKRRGIEVMTGDGVASADENGLTLQSGRRIDSATIVWSAGVAPSPMAAGLPLEKTKRGAIVTGADMRSVSDPSVWALGDCASIPDETGKPYPMTAQHAIREGPHLAENIVRVIRNQPTLPFKYHSLGMMAALGGRKAVAQLPGDRVITGFLAWFLWRSYYLLRLPGLDRQVRVAFDWTLDLVFPRDIAELRVEREEPGKPS